MGAELPSVPTYISPGVVVHAWNAPTLEAEVGNDHEAGLKKKKTHTHIFP